MYTDKNSMISAVLCVLTAVVCSEDDGVSGREVANLVEDLLYRDIVHDPDLDGNSISDVSATKRYSEFLGKRNLKNILQSNMDKRYNEFLGEKRNNIKRFNEFLGKRSSADELLGSVLSSHNHKRYSEFLGKRSPLLSNDKREAQKRYSEFLGKRSSISPVSDFSMSDILGDADTQAAKREDLKRYSEFLGKRYNEFLGKRENKRIVIPFS